MSQKARWTVLTYIAAHNNLHALGEQSFHQILGVGSSQEVAHGLFLDGQHGAARYLVGDPGRALEQEQLGTYDSGDPAGLVATAQWLFRQRPAERYGVVLWSHGTGWQPAQIEAVARGLPGARSQTAGSQAVGSQTAGSRTAGGHEVAGGRPIGGVGAAEAAERSRSPGSQVIFRTSLQRILAADSSAERAILFDDGTGHALDTLALEGVAREISASIGQPLDFLGMDACLMASAEVAHQIRRWVRCLVASQELVPGHSWPYDVIYGGLRDRPEQSAADLSRNVVQAYTDFYRARPPGAGDVTKVALDLAGADALAAAVGELAAALHSRMEDYAPALWRIQRETERSETRGGQRRDSKFRYHLWDLGSVAGRLAEGGAVGVGGDGVGGDGAGSPGPTAAVQVAAQRVVDVLRPGGPFVLAEGHAGEWFDGIAGLSVYLMPPGQQRIAPTYVETAFGRDTGWAGMLEAYHAADR